MKICVFGLGYVGTVSAACLASQGHFVLGVDSNPTKAELIRCGKSPVIEEGLHGLVANAVRDGCLKIVESAVEGVQQCDISLVCVGTPSQDTGALNLDIVRNVCVEIGKALYKKNSYHLVVVRSTMLPGSIQQVVIPTLSRYSGKKIGQQFGVCANPEFLREGSAVDDFFHPSKIVIGEFDKKSGDRVQSLYQNINAPLIRTEIAVAEIIKYVDNSWHALKICFANEIGEMCHCAGVDSHQVMDIFCRDEKLNISAAYLKPGFAFGGSCLPKDVRALNYWAKHNDLEFPLLASILPSNSAQIRRCLRMITATGKQKIGILGISFKAGTDDLRESPMIELAETLLGKGYELFIYDRTVQISSLTGANRDYIFHRIPHISRLMVDNIESLLTQVDVMVIGNMDNEFRTIGSRIPPECLVIDFVRMFSTQQIAGTYQGVSW